MDNLELDIDFLINSGQVKADAEKVKAEISGVGFSAEKAQAQINSNIQQMTKTIPEAANKAKGSFNGLQNSINQISRELPAFTYSAQTGFMAIANNIPILTDEIGRLRKANAELVASGQKGVPVWKQLISGFFSWGTALSLGITLLTVYGKEIGGFISSLFEGKKAIDAFKESQKSVAAQMSAAGEAAGKATLEVDAMQQKFEQAKAGVISKEAALKTYNEGIGKTLGITKDFNEAEERTLKNGDAYIELMFKKARAVAIMKLYTEEMGKAALEMAKTSEESVSYIMSGTKGKGLKNNKGEDMYEADAQRNREAAAKPFNERAEAFRKMWLGSNKELEDFAKTNQLKLDPETVNDNAAAKARKAFEDTVNSRKAMLDKIAALDAEYSRKGFTKDEEEQQALRDKFAAFRKIIEEENEKIAAFNKTSKKKISLIDVEQVAPIQKRAIEDLTYRQDTDKLKTELETQKQLFADFESYRDRMGEAAANKRFGKELGTAKTYLASLQAEYGKVKDIKAPTGVQQERINFLKAQLDKEQRLQEQQYTDLLTSLADYEQKRKNLTEKFERERAELISKGDGGAVVSLEANYKKDLEALDDANLKQLESYKALFEGIGDLSRTAAKTVIANGKQMLEAAVKSGKISKKEAENIRKELAKSEQSLGNRLPEGLTKVAGGLREAASLIAKFDAGAAKAVNTVASLAESAASITAGFASGNPFAVISGAVSAVSSLVDLFDRSDEKRATNEEKQQAALEKTRGFIESMNRLLELQAKIIEKSLGTDRIDAYRRQLSLITSDITATIKKLNDLEFKQPGTRGLVDYDINLANLNDILKTGGGRGPRGGTPDPVVETTLDTIDKVIAANKANIEALYGAIEAGRLVGNVEQLQELLKTYELLEGQLEQYRLKLQEVVTGTTFTNIVDTISQGFRDGLTSAQDFADSFEDMMKNAVIQSLKMQALEKPLKAFYDQLAADSESGGSLDATEIAKLKELYNSIIASAGEQFKNLQNLTGLNFDKPGDGSGGGKGNTLSGVIRGITADQADLLAGQFGGQRLATLETNVLLKINNQTGQESLAQMKQNMFYLVKIEDNTRRSAQVEETYLPKIAAGIDKLGSNTALRAQGG